MKKSLLFILLLCWSISNSFAQSRSTITGKVLAEDNTPIAGVSVFAVDSNVGTVTDGNGSFSINVPAGVTTLEFSFVGYKTVEVDIQGRSVINITLEEESLRVDDVVVTAMGITREKKTLGYASQEVKGATLEEGKQTDLNNALVGRVAGVRFFGGSGAAFDEGSLLLRGTTNLSGNGNQPIYVVDGVITDLSSINMADIQSLNVLKGPAATALYGSRGGNGAVVIATKRGEDGRSYVDFTQTLTFETLYMHSKWQNRYGGGYLGGYGALPGAEQLDTYTYRSSDPEWMRELDGVRYYDYATDESWGPELDGSPYAAWYTWDPTHPKWKQTAPYQAYPNNIDDIYRTGVTSNTNVAFSRSSEKSSVYVNLGNISRTGIQYNSKNTRRYLSFRSSFEVTERLRVNMSYRLTYTNTLNAAVQGYDALGAAYNVSQWFQRNVDMKELRDYMRPDGSIRSWNIVSYNNLDSKYMNNVWALYYYRKQTTKNTYNNFNVNATYQLIPKKLDVSAIVMGNIRNMRDENIKPIGLMATPHYRTTQRNVYDTQIQGRLHYGDRFAENRFVIDANLFVEQRDYSYYNLYGFTRDGLSVPNYYNVAASVGLPGSENTNRERQEQSIFGVANFSWDDRYFMEVSLRNDWSSTLPSSNNSYLYGGVSLSVLMHRFIPKATWLNFWKLRASAAQVGSAMDPYGVIEDYQVGTKYGSLTAMYMDVNMKDPNIKPTISTSWEVGTEFRMFSNRFYGDINLYLSDSKDQILNRSVTGASGYSSIKINTGLIRNKGIEITLGGVPVSTRNFEWNVTANFAKNQNVLKELGGGITELQLGSYGLNQTLRLIAVEGEPVGEIRGTTHLRDPQGRIILEQRSNPNDERGEYYMAYTTDPKKIGNVQPDFTGGFSTDFKWKNIVVTAAMDFQVGGNILSFTNLNGEGSGLLKSTAGNNDKGVGVRSPLSKGGGMKVTGVVNRGTADNPVYEEVTTYMAGKAYFDNKREIWENYCYDASYVKLRELTIGYTFPKEMLQKLNIGLQSLRVSFVATNPWLIYSGIPNVDASEITGDRAKSSATANAMERGNAFSTRMFGFSIGLRF